MKTVKTHLRTFGIALLAISIATVSFSCDEKKVEEKKEAHDHTGHEHPPKEDEPKYVDKPDIIIPTATAKQHYDLYSPRARRIEKEVRTDVTGGKFRATRSLYFSKEDLEQYLAYIEQESKTVGVKPSGLRFYFSVYPEEYKREADGSAIDANHQTIFVAPTVAKKRDGKTEYLSYTIGDQNNVILLQDILNGKTKAIGTTENGNAAVQEASILSFFATTVGDERSLVGNSMSEWPGDD